MRKKERARENAARAERRLEQVRLAFRRDAPKQDIVDVKMKKTASTPFASPDGTEGHYILIKLLCGRKKNSGHIIPRKRGASLTAIGPNRSLVKIGFDDENKVRAENLSIL